MTNGGNVAPLLSGWSASVSAAMTKAYALAAHGQPEAARAWVEATRVALDASNRPYLIWKVAFERPSIGGIDSELFQEWFRAFAQNAGLTLHVETIYGQNHHHIIESCFKGLARALRQAVELDPRASGAVPSTKGSL